MTPRNRQFFFRIILVLTPFLLIGLAELVFRIAGLWTPEPIVVVLPGSSGQMRAFNIHAGRRYFAERQTAVPMLTPEVFPAVKAPGTFRVLCLGESSTAGFPFDCQVPFPWQLGRILTEAYPDRRIEVLNAGMSAISSYVIVDMLPELLETQPDLVLVYAGHNEFYGVYGSASAISAGSSDLLVRAALAAQRTHVGHMVRRAIDMLRPAPADTVRDHALMQRVVGDHDIALGSPQYLHTMEGLRKNLSRIADACAARRIPVLFSTLVSNDRDLPPFAGTAADAPADVAASVQAGGLALRDGDTEKAALAFADVMERDSANADAMYGSAHLLLAAGDSSGARQRFRGARDRDRMRFRASTDANRIITAVANEKGAWLIDYADILAARSPARTIGHEWICDHLHPDTRGYYMLAAAFFVGIQQSRLLPPPAPGFRLRQEPYGVTPLDRAIGLTKVSAVMRRWPFKPGTVTPDTALANEDTACVRIAREYLRGEGVWSRAHAAMATSWIQRGEWDAARRECEAIALFVPDDPWPYRMIAETYRQQARWDLSAAALEQAARRSRDQGLLMYELGLARMHGGDLRGAIEAMAVAAAAPEFTADERANARFHLAGLLSDGGQREEAVAVLRTILTDLPTFQPARILLARLERQQR